MAEQIELGFKCRVFNATGFEMLGAVQKKANVGGHCPLLLTTIELQIHEKPHTPEADKEILASLEKCEVCSLRPKALDIMY